MPGVLWWWRNDIIADDRYIDALAATVAAIPDDDRRLNESDVFGIVASLTGHDPAILQSILDGITFQFCNDGNFIMAGSRWSLPDGQPTLTEWHPPTVAANELRGTLWGVRNRLVEERKAWKTQNCP